MAPLLLWVIVLGNAVAATAVPLIGWQHKVFSGQPEANGDRSQRHC